MIERKRRGLSAEQKAELWKRWKAGQSLHEIGRALGKDHVVIHFVLARYGGIAPPPRRRSRRALTLAEREDISRGVARGCSLRVIAQSLQRSPSTVSREVARHGGRTQYRAGHADSQTWESTSLARYCGRPPCRATSRLTVDTARCKHLAIARSDWPEAIPREMSVAARWHSNATSRRQFQFGEKGAAIGPTRRGKGSKIMAIADRHGLPIACTSPALRRMKPRSSKPRLGNFSREPHPNE